MSVISIVIAAVAILAVSIVFSMVGWGGGVLYVPILLALGLSIHDAATTSLFVIVATSVAAAIIYRRRRTIDWKLALVIEPPTLALAFLGGLLANHFDSTILEIIFAGILIIISILMIRPIPEDKETGVPHGWGCWSRRMEQNKYAVRLPSLMPVTAIAGFVAGMIGISGGIFKLPAMVLIGRVPIRIAIGTSSLMVAATAVAGFSGHMIGGSFNVLEALPLAAAAFVGGSFGSRLSSRMKLLILKVSIAVLLFLVSIWMLVSTLVL